MSVQEETAPVTALFAEVDARLQAMFPPSGPVAPHMIGVMSGVRTPVAMLGDGPKAMDLIDRGWRKTLNTSAELGRRREFSRWAQFYRIYARLHEALLGETPTVSAFLGMLGKDNGVDWSGEVISFLATSMSQALAELDDDDDNEDRESGQPPALKVGPATPVEKHPTGDVTGADDGGTDDSDDTDDGEADGGEPEETPAPQSRTPAARPRKTRARRAPASPATGGGPATVLSALTGTEDGVVLSSSDYGYRVTDTGREHDAALIALRINGGDADLLQNVAKVGSYAAEKAADVVYESLTAQGVTTRPLGKGTAATVAMIAVLGLDEAGLVELSPAMAAAVDALREVRGDSHVARLEELVASQREMLEMLQEQNVLLGRLLERGEVAGRLSAALLGERTGVATIPTTRQVRDVSVYTPGADALYEQTMDDVRTRAEKEAARRGRNGPWAEEN